MTESRRNPQGLHFWDERYSGEGFAYGTQPNRWLEGQAGVIRPGGHVLSLGEGEGRNAVWLAEQGFTVDAVDGFPVGLEEARRLACSSPQVHPPRNH